MPIEQKQQTQSANSPANIIILIGKDHNRQHLETRIEQAKKSIRKATGQGMKVKFDKIHILGDGKKTIQEVVKENEALLQSTEFTEDNAALFLLAHGGSNEKGFGGFIDNRQSLQEFLKAYPHLTKFPIKTGFCYDGSMFKTATQKELKELKELGKLEDIDIDNIEELEELELLEELEELKIKRLEELTDKIETNRGNSIIKDATISTFTNSKFPELTSDIIENIGQYIENIYSNPKSPLQQLIAEDLASPSSRYILHNNKITKLSRFLKGLNVDSDEVKDNDLKGLAKEFINHRKEQLKQAYPDKKGFIETLGKEEELNSLVDKILNKALRLFADRGTPSAVEILLSKEEEIDINRQDQDGETALGLACEKGHQEIVKMLLASEKINLNLQTNDGVTALYIACAKGHQEIVKMLLANKKIDPNLQTKNGNTALHIACAKGHQKVVGMLLGKGANPDITDQEDWTALHFACENGNKEVVGMLLKKGVDPTIQDKDGYTALHLACQNSPKEIVETLLANKEINPDSKNKYGWTALHIACEEGFQDIVEKLLTNKKIDPNITDRNGNTALHFAYEEGNQKIVETLLENEKIDPNIPNQDGFTVLQFACYNGYQEIVEIMLAKKRVDINLTGKEGQTALDAAIANNRQEIMDYLVSHGALSGTELSQKKSSKSSEAKDGETPSSSPAPTGNPAILASGEKAKGHQ